MTRATRTEVGVNHAPDPVVTAGLNVLLYVNAGFALSELYRSSVALMRVRETRKIFENRKSSWLMRSPMSVPGATRSIVTFATPPDGARPRNVATCAAGML